MASQYKQFTADTQVAVGIGKLKGIFCSAASNTPTLALYDSATASASDPKIIDTFTPVAGTMYPLPGDDAGIAFTKGLWADIGGTVSFTIIFEGAKP